MRYRTVASDDVSASTPHSKTTYPTFPRTPQERSKQACLMSGHLVEASVEPDNEEVDYHRSVVEKTA